MILHIMYVIFLSFNPKLKYSTYLTQTHSPTDQAYSDGANNTWIHNIYSATGYTYHQLVARLVFLEPRHQRLPARQNGMKKQAIYDDINIGVNELWTFNNRNSTWINNF